MIAAAVVLRDGAPEVVDGFPTLRAGLFSIERATILDTWSTAGMRGTGSNDCVFENVFVSDEFTFDWLNARSTWQQGAFANIPLPLQTAGGLAAVVLGTARHALDELYGIAQVKVPLGTRATLRERAIAQTQYAKTEGLLGARAYFYQCHDEVWRKGEAGESFNLQDRALMRLGNVTSAKLTLRAVDLVADAAGMKAAKTSSPIERCWRDAHTAIQHMLLNTARFEVIARAVRARSWFATGLILSASGKDRWERSGEAFTYSKRCGFRSVR